MLQGPKHLEVAEADNFSFSSWVNAGPGFRPESMYSGWEHFTGSHAWGQQPVSGNKRKSHQVPHLKGPGNLKGPGPEWESCCKPTEDWGGGGGTMVAVVGTTASSAGGCSIARGCCLLLLGCTEGEPWGHRHKAGAEPTGCGRNIGTWCSWWRRGQGRWWSLARKILWPMLLSTTDLT